MKRVLIACFFTIVAGGLLRAQDSIEEVSYSNVNWKQKFSRANSLSKSKDKPILIFFTGSDWCGPCKMLVADVFESEKFKELSDLEFVLYEADFPRNKNLVSDSQKSDNLKLKNKYNVNSYPTILIVNSKGKELGKLKGYNLMRDTSYHYSFFENTLNKIK
jgi:thioredoxin-related protein